MKNNIKILLFIILSIFIVSSCSKDKSSPTSPDLVIDRELVGTWELTSILSPYQATPEQLGLSLTTVFKDDGTFEFTTTQSDSTTIDTGTWGTADGNITITFEGEDSATSPYTIEGTKATIENFPVNYLGTSILATLEFTKQ